jgi:hypothetical protein
VRFIWTWVELRKLLRRLSWHPLFARFATAHCDEKRFASLPPLDLLSPPPTYTALSLLVRQARQFLRELTVPAHKHGSMLEIKALVEEAEGELSKALQLESLGEWQQALVHRRHCEERICHLSKHITGMLEQSWKSAPNKDGSEAQLWHDEGKFFLVALVAAFLQHVYAHLQNLVALVTAGLLLVLLASNSYPFQPRQPLMLFSWVTILTVVAATILIFVQMSRDKVLSLLSGTTPGKLNVTRDFVVRVLIHGLVPIVALLGAQFPETLRQIFSWLSVFQSSGR